MILLSKLVLMISVINNSLINLFGKILQTRISAMQSSQQQDSSQVKKLNHKHIKDKIESLHTQKGKRIKRLQQQRLRKQKLMQQLQMAECTFSPQIMSHTNKAIPKQQKFNIIQFLKREQNWTRSKQKKIQLIRNQKSLQQEKQYTFRPQVSDKTKRCAVSRKDAKSDLIKIEFSDKKNNERLKLKGVSNRSSVAAVSYSGRNSNAKPNYVNQSKSYKQIYQNKHVMKQHLKQQQKPFHLQTSYGQCHINLTTTDSRSECFGIIKKLNYLASYGQRWASRNFHHYHLPIQQSRMEINTSKFVRKQANAKNKILVETSLVPKNSIRDVLDDNQQLQEIEIENSQISIREADEKLVLINQQVDDQDPHQQVIQKVFESQLNENETQRGHYVDSQDLAQKNTSTSNNQNNQISQHKTSNIQKQVNPEDQQSEIKEQTQTQIKDSEQLRQTSINQSICFKNTSQVYLTIKDQTYEQKTQSIQQEVAQV